MIASWFDGRMAMTATSIRSETAHRVRRHTRTTGESIRRMRLAAGLSRAGLARAVSIHPTYLTRIEAGTVIASLPVLTAIGVALGCDTSFRFFEGAGPRLHDRYQAPMTEGLLGRLDLRRWTPELEVPITEPARGVIDLVIDERRAPLVVATEMQSRIERLEQQIRWMAEKADGPAARRRAMGQQQVVSRLLVLRSTIETRELARRYERTLAAAFPARAGDVVDALTTPDAPWPGAGLVWMRVEKGVAHLLDGPPRGVSLGR
ncbi:MAG: helix-turn-helix domain-containing protein [Candidatus Limnocylindrales bacterium]